MARSRRYVELLSRLGELRRHLLPAKFDPTKPYSRRQYDRVHSYRLLAHAEFESCLEDLARATAQTAWLGFRVDGQPRTCLTALVAFHEGNWSSPALMDT